MSAGTVPSNCNYGHTCCNACNYGQPQEQSSASEGCDCCNNNSEDCCDQQNEVNNDITEIVNDEKEKPKILKTLHKALMRMFGPHPTIHKEINAETDSTVTVESTTMISDGYSSSTDSYSTISTNNLAVSIDFTGLTDSYSISTTSSSTVLDSTIISTSSTDTTGTTDKISTVTTSENTVFIEAESA